jgi:integrase
MWSPGAGSVADINTKLTKRVIDGAEPGRSRYVLWDSDLKGFGLRIETSGTKSFILRYRPNGGGRVEPKRFVTIGRYGTLAPDEARSLAKAILGNVAKGGDPSAERASTKSTPTVQTLYEEFDRYHIAVNLKPSTAISYRSTFKKHILPLWGKRRADTLGRPDMLRFRADMADHKVTANRALAILSGMFGWAIENQYLSGIANPITGVSRYTEQSRERFLSVIELERLGAAIREAETTGLPWEVDETGAKAKHAPKVGKRHTPISQQAAGALRLLLFTGARLREILHLKWDWVDFERAVIFLPDSKTGKKAIYLNGPALAVLSSLPRVSEYVFPGEARTAPSTGARKTDQPRADLKRPWNGVRKLAGLGDVRLHDLRHTHASFGAGSNIGLPIIGKLLGHSQTRTTAKYSHLDADPIRRASEAIGVKLAEALGDPLKMDSAEIVPIRKGRDSG